MDVRMHRDNTRYTLTNENDELISELSCIDYNLKNFDWILFADIITNEKYQNMGYATKLICKAYENVQSEHSNKGVYLFVDANNFKAIKLYRELGFTILKTYYLNDRKYFIMIKGKADIMQFKDRRFS
jgi:RimJ/RimL family protein N-acetyltransferase